MRLGRRPVLKLRRAFAHLVDQRRREAAPQRLLIGEQRVAADEHVVAVVTDESSAWQPSPTNARRAIWSVWPYVPSPC